MSNKAIRNSNILLVLLIIVLISITYIAYPIIGIIPKIISFLIIIADVSLIIFGECIILYNKGKGYE